METAEGATSDQETEFNDSKESIIAIDVREKKAMGCSIFSTTDGVLKIGNDIPMASEEVAEQFLNYAQPTTILISRRVPETILTFVDKQVKRSANKLTLRLVPPSEFSHLFACEELLSLNNGLNSFQATTSPPDIEKQYVDENVRALQNSDHQEPYCMKLVRCSSLIDLDSVVSLSCAGAILTDLHRRRSHASSSSSPIAEHMFNVRSITLFNLSDYVFVNEESLLSLQIINHEAHPNSQVWNVDSKSSAEKENLSVYGLIHPLTSTPQGRVHLRHMFLKPMSNLDIISDRHRTISLLLQPNNEEKTRHAVSILRNMGNIDHTIIDGITPLPLTLVGDMINRVVNFEQAKSQERYSVRTGVDAELDELKRQYDGMSSFLTQVANHVADDLPVWARQYIRSCIFLPQLGFLTVVEQDSQLGNTRFDGEGIGGDLWTKSFTNNGTAYYKNRHMVELDEQYGDIYSQISDREVEMMQKLATDVIFHENALLKAANICAEFDALLALAIGAVKYGWNEPQMTAANIIHIKGGRHPLQELLVPSFVSNDCYIGGENVAPGHQVQALVLTGPNQSGKSVYIKQVAVIVYLAHIGSFVPADEALIGTVDKILTRIPSRESVSRTRSTFAFDLKQVSQAMKYSTSRSLIIMDEFGNGTTADGGAGMFTAMLDYFLSPTAAMPKLLVATHFHEIFTHGYLGQHRKLTLSHMDVRTNWDATNTEDKVIYLFKLTQGFNSTSLGCQCAILSGIPEVIINRAGVISELISHNKDLTYIQSILSSSKENYFQNIKLDLINTKIDKVIKKLLS
ncbi:muts domain V domain-containing protein [Trichoderma ceciliae]